MQRTIRHEFMLNQPPEVVWYYLTNADLLAQWLMPNDFLPVVGHRFQFRAKPKVKFGFDGTIYGEVLEIIPNKKLVYSWKGGLSENSPSLDSVVTWTLTPSGDRTLLRLEHSGFRGIKNYMAFVVMNMGWMKIGKRLSAQTQLTTYGA